MYDCHERIKLKINTSKCQLCPFDKKIFIQCRIRFRKRRTKIRINPYLKLKMNTIQQLNGCLVIFELIGFQFFSLKALNQANYKDRPTAFRAIYMVTILVFLAIKMYFFIMMSIEYNKSDVKITAKNVVMLAIQRFMDFGLVVVFLTNLIQSFMSTQSIKMVFINVEKIVQLVKNEFKVIINFEKIRFATWKRFYIMLICVGAFHAITSYLMFCNNQTILQMLTAVVPVFFLIMIVYKFIFYVGMINHQLKFLAKLLDNIFVYKSSKIVESFPKKLVKFDDPIRKLRAARQIYNYIYHNSTLINDSLGLTILVLLAVLVTSLTACGYKIFVIVIGGLPTDEIPGKYFKTVLSKTNTNLYLLETSYIILLLESILIMIVLHCQQSQKIVSLNCLKNFNFFFSPKIVV